MTIVLVILAAALYVTGSMLVQRTTPTAADVTWLAGPGRGREGGAGSEDVRDVCRRYLTRHRRHRLAGGLFGVAFAGIVGVRWFGSISISIGQGSPLADLLFCGLCGVIVGTLSAESFRLTSMTPARSAASLLPRPPSVGRERVLLARSLAVVAVGVGVVAFATDHGGVALATVLILVAPFGVAEMVRTVIAGRERPVMTDRARVLDERLRGFAASSVSFLLAATGFLMLGWTSSKVIGLTGAMAFVRFCVVIVSLVGVVATLRRAAPRPHHPPVARSPDVALASTAGPDAHS